jgi:hypothetical protein
MKPTFISVLCAAFLVSQAHAQGLLQTHRISADLAAAISTMPAPVPGWTKSRTG